MAIIAIFTLGSGICGGANTGAMLIAGRAVQGVGSGGIVLTVSESRHLLCRPFGAVTFVPPISEPYTNVHSKISSCPI